MAGLYGKTVKKIVTFSIPFWFLFFGSPSSKVSAERKAGGTADYLPDR